MGKSYAEAIKLCTDLVPKLNINIDLTAEDLVGEAEDSRSQELEETMERLAEKHWFQMLLLKAHEHGYKIIKKEGLKKLDNS